MNEHPSDTELRGFERHMLAADRALAIDDHLAVCDACRARASSLGRAQARLVELAADVLAVEAHLTDEQLDRYVAGHLPADERTRLAGHVAHCDECGRSVDDLQRWSAARPNPRRRVYLAAAAAVLLLLSPFAIGRWIPDAPTRGTPSIVGLDLLTAGQQARVREALRAGVAEPPSVLTEMMTGSEALMGATGAQPFRLTAPLMTVTVTDRPTFRWNALPGADEYTIAVLDADLHPVVGPVTLTGTSWTPSEPLVRDRSYVWQVSARRGATSVTAPAPPAPLARFRVMDAGNATVFERVNRAEPGAHLLLGLALAQAGARQDADVHLRQVPRDEPYADVARRTLERLTPPSAP